MLGMGIIRINRTERRKNTLQDIDKILTQQSAEFSEAVKESRLEPAITIAATMLSSLEGVIGDIKGMIEEVRMASRLYPKGIISLHPIPLSFGENIIDLHLSKDEIIYARDLFNTQIEKTREDIVMLESMKNAIMNHITLEVRPHELFEGQKVYLGQGKVIIPVSKGSDVKYNVMSVFYSNERKQLDFSIVNDKPLDSEADAISIYTDPKDLASLVIAKNTEKYPLRETAMPIVAERYRKNAGFEKIPIKII